MAEQSGAHTPSPQQHGGFVEPRQLEGRKQNPAGPHQ